MYFGSGGGVVVVVVVVIGAQEPNLDKMGGGFAFVQGWTSKVEVGRGAVYDQPAG
jgi:hypothetical protein